MKESEANEIFALLHASFPGTALEEPEVGLWLADLAPLDAEAATHTALLIRKSALRFPVWAEFRQTYQTTIDRLRRERSQKFGLPEPREDDPDWVHQWFDMRKAGDLRALPQQEQGYKSLAVQSFKSSVTHGQEYDWPPKEGVLDD